jgi:hypothetical protein
MFKVHRSVKGITVTMLAALTFIMIVWAHGRSASQPPRGETNSVKAVQLRITFGSHWANVTEIEGGAFTVEREGKKLAITPYIRDEGKVELRVFKVVQNDGKGTMEAVGTLLVGKGLTKLEGNGLVLGVQVLNANKTLSSDLLTASGVTCCARACDGTLVCGLCVCTDCSRCGPGWCDCPQPLPPDVD